MSHKKWAIPPDFRENPEGFADYIRDLHNDVYGLGSDVQGQLDGTNAPLIHDNSPDHTQGTDQFLDQGGANQVGAADAADAVVKKHDPGSNHKVLKQGSDPSDTTASSVSVTSPDASDLGTVITLANEEKGDINQLVSDVNVIAGKLNTLLANMRTAGLIA